MIRVTIKKPDGSEEKLAPFRDYNELGEWMREHQGSYIEVVAQTGPPEEIRQGRE